MNYRRTSSRLHQCYPFSSDVPIRRRSCCCDLCGKQTEFQILSNAMKPLQTQQVIEKLESPQTLSEEILKLNRNERTLSTTATNSNHEKQPKKPRRMSCHCSECGEMSLVQQKYKDIPLLKQRRQPRAFMIKKKNPPILKHSRTLQLEQMQSRSRIDPTQLIQKKKQMISLRNIETRFLHRRLKTECFSLSQIALPAIKDFSCRTFRKYL